MPRETEGSMPPNNQVTKWITNHSRGIATAKMINPINAKNKNFIILPIIVFVAKIKAR